MSPEDAAPQAMVRRRQRRPEPRPLRLRLRGRGLLPPLQAQVICIVGCGLPGVQDVAAGGMPTAKPWKLILGSAPFGIKGAGFYFLFRSLRTFPSSLVSLSHQTSKFPPTPSNSSTSPRLIRMISTQVLYLDSNPIP